MIRLSANTGYERVLVDDCLDTIDVDLSDKNGINKVADFSENSDQMAQISSLQNNVNVPITRPPSKSRDKLFSFLFLFHFCLVFLIVNLLEEDLIVLADIPAAGSWTSMLMISIVMGSFLGTFSSILFSRIESPRHTCLKTSLIASTILKLIVGLNVLLYGSVWRLSGIIFIFSAILDCSQLSYAQDNLIFTLSLIDLSTSIMSKFGSAIIMCYSFIIGMHTCLLLWWGALFTEYISEVSGHELREIAVVMVLISSLYSITQFFHSYLGSVTGGCVLYYYSRDGVPNHTGRSNTNQNGNKEDPFDPSDLLDGDEEEVLPEHSRVVSLYLRCGISSSFGSIIKSAFLSPPAHLIMAAVSWLKRRKRAWWAFVTFSVAGDEMLLEQLHQVSRRHSRYTVSYFTLYGRTFARAAEDLAQKFDLFSVGEDDSTSTVFASWASVSAIAVATTLTLLAEEKEGAYWPLFLILCYSLCYTSMSLPLYFFQSAVDALAVAYVIFPDRFGKTHPIVSQRFSRKTEIKGTI